MIEHKYIARKDDSYRKEQVVLSVHLSLFEKISQGWKRLYCRKASCTETRWLRL
jgi:hypothetical protein